MAHDERELNKTIRKLKGELRQLRKLLHQTESELALIKSLWEQDVIDMAKKDRRKRVAKKPDNICPECGNPTITTMEIGIFVLTRCSSCDYFNREEKK